MTIALILLAASVLLEMLLWLGITWKYRRISASLLAVVTGIVTGWLLSLKLDVATLIFSILSIYRVVNLMRLVENRLHPDFLYHASRKTSLWLIGLQALTLGVDRFASVNHINILTGFYIVAVLQILVAIVLAASTFRHIATTKAPFFEFNIPSRDLPTVTVAIPARNETRDLEECLQSLVSSDYPKLEIIVLDDCSQNKKTPEIIRSFAQQGVRFIAGKMPPDSWLAKNYAYQQLYEESNGSLVMFCGVDCRFQPGTIHALVTNMIKKNKTMVSVMPKNTSFSLGSLLVQPARYAWEMALPRRMLGRPPVLSTCWIMSRDALRAAGGFKSVSRKAVPESHFAKYTANHADGYSFMRSDEVISLQSVKSYQEQLATAVRIRYPQLHRRPEMVALNSAAEFTVLMWPLLVGIVALYSHEWPLALLSLLGFIAVNAQHAAIVSAAYNKFHPGSLLIMPFAAIYDICLLNYSMWQYEFSEVIWKGRNVCLPFMQVIPSLPQVPGTPQEK